MISINRHTLSNGLRIVHHEDRSTQMVALNIAYNVGARDEHPEHTGFAHLFEHLMFGGSVNIPDYNTPVQMAGGDSNAWTNNDMTNYYITLPAQNVETAFWLESDRMLSLDFSPQSLEVQRHVVTEEFKQRCLNKPYGDAAHLLRGLAYKVHPYSWPTLGKDISHIENASLEEVRDFFFRFYAPGNAVLAVAGGISMEETVRLAEKWFAPIPSRKVSPKRLPAEPEQTEMRRLSVERNVPVSALYMAFHKGDRMSQDFYAADMITDILANGRSSRFVESLVRGKRVFSSIDAYVTNSFDPGLLQITGKPSAGVSLEEAEAAVWDELDRLKVELVAEDELEKVRNRYEAEQIFSSTSYLNVASTMAFFELLGDAELANDDVARYRATSATQLREAATRILGRENCSVVLYRKA